MNYQQATDLIRSHTDYGGSVDVHALAVAMSSAPAVDAGARDEQTEADEREAAYREAIKPRPETSGVGMYCQPGDRREPRWIVMYDDANRNIAVFEDEQDARDCFAKSEAMGWNCWLFSPTTRAALSEKGEAAVPIYQARLEGQFKWMDFPKADWDLRQGSMYEKRIVYTAAPAAHLTSNAPESNDRQMDGGGRLMGLKAEIDRLNAIINRPHADDFLKAVSIEGEHQRQRWGSEHDAGKAPADWFWLIGYLAGKALHAHAAGNVEKAEHHIITTAAACANWHRNMFDKTDMRPGIDGEAALRASSATASDKEQA